LQEVEKLAFSGFVLGILLGAFIVPAILADPQATLETGKQVVSSITQIVEVFT